MKKLIVIIIILLSINVVANEKAMIDAFSRFGLDIYGTGMLYVDHQKYKGYELPYYILNKPYESERIKNNILKYLNNGDYMKLQFYISNGEKPTKGIYETLRDFIDPNNPNDSEIIKEFNKYRKISDFDFFIDNNDSFYNDLTFFLDNSNIDGINGMIRIAEYILKMNNDDIIKLCEFIIEADIEIIECKDTDDMIYDTVNIIIDKGGDDIYFLSKPNTLIIDISGNDKYIATNDYTIACGNGGLSMIIDLDGNDYYEGKNYSTACAINGIGIINDRNGDDIYIGKTFTLAASINGFSLILDDNGNDVYLSEGFSQGFGTYQGTGIIHDRSGYDNYTVKNGIADHRENDYHAHLSQGFGYGIRDIASGGVGVLYDNNGNDVYSGEYFVQGSSYWYSMGFLCDDDGNDKYFARRYSQGAGTHFTFGMLSDLNGDDIYNSWGMSQGCGHDWAIGILNDYNGDDTYISSWLSMGAGNVCGMGILNDFNGNDTYSYKETSCGYADTTNEYHSTGILYDINGDAIINGVSAETRINSLWGIIINEK